MRLTPPAALVAVSLVVTGCGVLSSATCDFAADDQIESILGETELETFNVERLDECTFTSVDDPSQQVVVRVETVPDAQIFVEHAIEATADPSRVQDLGLGEGAVMFEDEAVLGRTGDQVALITGTVPTEELVDVLAITLDLLVPTE